VTYSLFNLSFAPQLQSCINTAPVSNALSRVCYASTVPPSNMTKLCYCDTTQWSDTVIEQERSLATSTRPRPSHAIRKVQSLRATEFQARGY